MTERLYYTDSHLVTFTATVNDVLDLGGRTAVVLDRTAFYPSSGGQPFDVGVLGGSLVEEVIDLDDGRVAHIVNAPLSPGQTLQGHLDWRRRFDHMQQHTGQHVLSAAFEHVHGARTESFHLGSEASTIDLASALAAEDIARAEDEANRIVWEDRVVRVRFASEEEAASLPLRKEPARREILRLVEVDGFDLSACGGTHVVRTGEIGLISVTTHERFKGGTRVEFVCGRRALERFRQHGSVIAAIVRRLSALPGELPAAIDRLQEEAKELRQAVRALQTRLARSEAAAYAARAVDLGALRLIAERVEEWDAQGVKVLAAEIAAVPGHAAVLLTAGTPPQIVIARARDVSLDASAILKALLARFGGRGGARPELAQGGGLAGPPDEILAAARDMLGK